MHLEVDASCNEFMYAVRALKYTIHGSRKVGQLLILLKMLLLTFEELHTYIDHMVHRLFQPFRTASGPDLSTKKRNKNSRVITVLVVKRSTTNGKKNPSNTNNILYGPRIESELDNTDSHHIFILKDLIICEADSQGHI